MKALVYTAREELTWCEQPNPKPGHGEELVAIEAGGICGSDMHAYQGHDPRRVPPLILGHEAVGTVLDGAQAGQKVVLNPLITCGKCSECIRGRPNLCVDRELIGMVRPGAFAEQIAIPTANLIELPTDMQAECAALTEPGATALHAINLAKKVLSLPIEECRVLILGGGSVGLLCTLLVKSYGATEIHLGETNARRRTTAISSTDAKVFDPKTEMPKTDYFDMVFDAVGSAKTRELSIAAVRPGGVIVHIGLADNSGHMDVRRLTLQEITFIGCYTYTPDDLRATLAKLHSGELGDLSWVEKRKLSDGASAFADLLAGQCAAAKIVLQV